MREIFQWEVRSWSRALPLWERYLPAVRPAAALGLGEREGGLSLWLAQKGFDVHCTDLRPLPQATSELHARHAFVGTITYAQADATALPYADGTFHVVFFKSMLGALGTKEAQARAVREMHRVLRPGGVLLFAENLQGTLLHRALRRRFVAWDRYWRYLHPVHDRDLFAPFAHVEDHCTGLWANLGRSETQRDLLARMDPLWTTFVPRPYRTIWYGAAVKAGS